jgi:hypothetical protein
MRMEAYAPTSAHSHGLPSSSCQLYISLSPFQPSCPCPPTTQPLHPPLPQNLTSLADYSVMLQDAMALVRVKGKPSLFITMTTNPKWDGILRELLHGQNPKDCPDLVSRVFAGKLKALLHDVEQGQFFGKCAGRVHVVEFQKHGLPHAHILLILAGRTSCIIVNTIHYVNTMNTMTALYVLRSLMRQTTPACTI